jgi:hypothetical protein
MTLTRARGPKGLCLVCSVRHKVRVRWPQLVRWNKMKNLSVLTLPPGSSNPEVPYPIIFRGAVFADSGRFDSCTTLWLHALRLRQDTGSLHWSGLFMSLKGTVSQVFLGSFSELWKKYVPYMSAVAFTASERNLTKSNRIRGRAQKGPKICRESVPINTFSITGY